MSTTADDDDALAAHLESLQIRGALENLIQKSHAMLEEIDNFIIFLRSKNWHEGKVEYRHFRNDVEHDIAGLEKLSKSDYSSLKIQHSFNSSNLPFMQAVWDAAKRSSGIISLRRHSSQLDVIANGGLKWVKVSTISEKRLLLEMAKVGWEWSGPADSDDDEDDGDENIRIADDEDSDISILKMAQTLSRSAASTRVKYRHPKIHLVLPRITSGKIRDVDILLDQIRSLGVQVYCGNELADPPVLETVLDNMVFDEFNGFSDVLNIDCTLLLALVSDISHSQVDEAPWFNKAIRRQLEIEEKEYLLPSTLWPAMAEHELVCTHEAAKRMMEIVDNIGTENEKNRTSVLLATDPGQTSSQLRDKFQLYTRHEIPDSWRLPIRIVPSIQLDDPRLPPLANTVASQLTDINSSVLLYGWATGYTTLTSNRTVARQVESIIEQHRTSDGDDGPDLWILRTSRSLVAKEKGRQPTILSSNHETSPESL